MTNPVPISPTIKDLQQLLTSNKKLEGQARQNIKTFINANKFRTVPIFKMTPMMHYLVYFLRSQVFLYSCLNIGITAYNLKTKWHRERIRTKLLVLSGLSVLAVIGMIKGSAAITKKAVSQIVYLPESNRFIFKFMNPWFGTHQLQAATQNVSPITQKKWFQQVNYQIQTDEGKKRRFTTKIFGEWTNKKWFESILKNKEM